jgi:sec-independent protein translocase protein TatA
VSTGEIILILFVYLLFFGAKGIPSLAQTMGKAIYQFRNAAKDVQDEIMKGASDIKKEMQIPLDQVGMDNTPSSTIAHSHAQATKEGAPPSTTIDSPKDASPSEDSPSTGK